MEKFQIKKIKRSELKKAEYNPRRINDNARKNLERGMKKHGLLCPIVWNEVTGNIVSGHQRIAVLDKESKGENYELTVSVVHLDEKSEKEANILMNNTEAQGEFDIEQLMGLIEVGDIDLEFAGFDASSVIRMMGDDIRSPLSGELADEVAQRVNEMRDSVESTKKKSKDRNDSEFYMVAIFRDNAARSKFFADHNLEDNRYQDARIVIESIIDHSRGSTESIQS